MFYIFMVVVLKSLDINFSEIKDKISKYKGTAIVSTGSKNEIVDTLAH